MYDSQAQILAESDVLRSESAAEDGGGEQAKATPSTPNPFFFLFITLKPRVEWYTSL